MLFTQFLSVLQKSWNYLGLKIGLLFKAHCSIQFGVRKFGLTVLVEYFVFSSSVLLLAVILDPWVAMPLCLSVGPQQVLWTCYSVVSVLICYCCYSL